jgi:hypothetical protein
VTAQEAYEAVSGDGFNKADLTRLAEEYPEVRSTLPEALRRPLD